MPGWLPQPHWHDALACTDGSGPREDAQVRPGRGPLGLQPAALRDADYDTDMRLQNAFWNQCLIIDYRIRATERAMRTTEYWSRADRYREHADDLRALQYGMGCLG
ncbi:hypothetical protein ACTMU2_12585 [Cupriavidus basilensis]